MKRFVGRFARFASYAVALLLVLSATLVSLGQYYFPLLAGHRDELLAWVRPRLPFGLEVGKLNAEWTGLAPTFYVDDLRLHALEDPTLTILSSRHSEIRLDIFRSLISLAPRLRKLTAENVELGFVEDTDGRWRVAGTHASRAPSNPRAILAFFMAIEEIDLRGAQLVANLRDGSRVETRGSTLLLENYRRFRRLSIDARDLPGGGSLTLVVESRGDPRVPWRFDAQAHARFTGLNPAALAPLARARVALPDANVDGEVWATLRRGGALSLQGSIATPLLKLGRWAATSQLEAARDLKLGFAADIAKDAAVVWIDGLGFDWYNEHVALDRLRIDLGAGPRRRLQVAADYLDIGMVAGVVKDARLLHGTWEEALNDLEPYGGLANAHFEMQLPVPAPLDFRFRARLIDVSASPWRHAPGIRNAEGYVEFGPRTGFADVASGALTLEFPHLYADDIDLDAVLGRVHWDRSDGVHVESRLLTVRDGDADMHAAFDLLFRRDPDLDDEFMLSVGIRGGDVGMRRKYIPHVVDAGLRKWLDQSIESGAIDSAGFAYHASFSRPGHPYSYQLQFAADVHDGNITYDPRWPAVNDMRGHVLIDGPGVQGWVESARVLRSQVIDGGFTVAPVDGQRRIQVQATVEGDTADGLQVINDSPIAALTGGALENWRAKGAMRATIDLDMPFGRAPDASNARVRVDAALSDTACYLGDYDLPIDDLHGAIHYDLGTGLHSDGLDGMLWGRPLHATIAGGTAEDPGLIHIAVDGSVDAVALEKWLDADVAGYLSGASPFRVALQQVRGAGFVTTIESDLSGIASTLPEPLAKAPEAPLPLRLELRPADGRTQVRADLDGRLRAAFERTPQGLVAGEIALGSEPRSGGEGLRIVGALDHGDAADWIRTVRSLLTRNLGRDHAPGNRLRIDGLRVASARLLGGTVTGVRLDSRWEQDDFVLAFDSDLVQGEFREPADHAKPSQLHLSRLQLQPFLAPAAPKPDATGETPAPAAVSDGAADAQTDEDAVTREMESNWSQLRDARLPPADISIDRLLHGDKNLGQWSLHVVSDADAIELSDIRAELPGLVVHGLESGSGGSYRLYWDADKPRSALKAGLEIRDIGAFFASWGYARVIESRRGRVDIALDWPGYPMQLSMAKSEGTLDFTLHDGHLTQESSNNPLQRVLGVLSIDQVLRRMKLDFKDFYQTGLSFDRFEGAVDLGNGHASTREPLEINGPSAHIRFTGQSDLRARTVDADLIMTLPIGSNLPWMAALAGGPAAAAGAFVASRLFESQIGKFSSALYKVSGSMDEPKLELVKVFDAGDAPTKAAPAGAPPAAAPATGTTAPGAASPAQPSPSATPLPSGQPAEQENAP